VNMTKTQDDISCKEESCFFKENNEYNHVCNHCERNEKSTSKDDDYRTVIERSGY